MFSSLTPHLTGPNTTDEVRKAYILQYARPTPPSSRATRRRHLPLRLPCTSRRAPVHRSPRAHPGLSVWATRGPDHAAADDGSASWPGSSLGAPGTGRGGGRPPAHTRGGPCPRRRRSGRRCGPWRPPRSASSSTSVVLLGSRGTSAERLVPTSTCSTITSRRALLGLVLHLARLAEQHDRAVVHRVVERRAGEHDPSSSVMVTHTSLPASAAWRCRRRRGGRGRRRHGRRSSAGRAARRRPRSRRGRCRPRRSPRRPSPVAQVPRSGRRRTLVRSVATSGRPWPSSWRPPARQRRFG